MIEPDSPPPAPTSGHRPGDRRAGHRGRVVMFWDLMYTVLRTVADRAENFYGTVGIFLVAGAVIAILGAVAFAQIGDFVRDGSTQAFDLAILRWFGAHQTRRLTQIAVELTYLGTGTVVLMIVGVSALFLWHTEHKHSARLLLAAVAGNILLNGVLKMVFHRQRPDVFVWGTSAVSSSFPSGHAMSATVCYGTVAYLVSRLQAHLWSRVATLTAAVILILLICTTRLYLGVHYPTDVIAGIFVGLAWAGFCMATLEASLVLARHRRPHEVEERPSAVEQQRV